MHLQSQVIDPELDPGHKSVLISFSACVSCTCNFYLQPGHLGTSITHVQVVVGCVVLIFEFIEDF